MDAKSYHSLMLELETLEPKKSLQMSELLDVSDELRQVITWMIRKVQFQDRALAGHLGLKLSEVRKLLILMLYKGLITETEKEDGQYRTKLTIEPRYRVENDILNLFDE